MPNPDDLLTPTEVADLLRVAKSTVFRLVDNGELEAIRFGARVVRFRRSDVDALLANKAAS